MENKYNLIGTLVKVLILILIVMGIVLYANRLSNRVTDNEIKLMEDAIRKYTVQCYCLEGAYPKDIAYLANNYTLSLDTKKYVYHYRFIGSNMMPEIGVFAAKQ
ncbi:MAG: hypothetical protein RSD88_03625 [Anaerovoracaceae bacterium]